MNAISARLHGWRFPLSATILAALSVTGLSAWHRQQFSWADRPAAGTPAEAVPAWAPTLPPPRPTAAQLQRAEQARVRLEKAGLALDGPTFVQAVATRQRTVIQLMREAGQDLDARGQGGATALFASAVGEDWPLFEQLLSAGAVPNLANDQGITPLMAAARAAYLPAMRQLLEHGAEPGAQDAAHRTAAHYALAAQAPEALHFLLEHGTPVTGGSEGEGSLVAAALATQDWQFIEPVLASAPAGLAWTSLSRAALETALASQQVPHIALLLAHHQGAPTAEGQAQPLLAYALLGNDIPRFKLLLEAGANPNTPLGSPVEKAFTQRITREEFRSYVASEPGFTTLMLAAGLGRTEFVKALLEKGARRGLGTDRYKMTALSFAAITESAETMQLLIDASPRPEEIRIEVSLGAQRATMLRHGLSVFTTRISSGRPGYATPTGDFVVTDKHADHKSTIYKVNMPFFMRLNCRDFGMHEGVIPGHPASHGCIRLPGESARQLFKEVPVGTLVTIRE